MLAKLAFANVRRSYKDFAIYFFTLLIGVAVFYAFNSITAQDAVMEKIYNDKFRIIEPDEAMNTLLKTILELQGYEIIENHNETTPAVIILDAGDVESQKGLDLCKKLKTDERLLNSKLIVTSIFHDKETVLNCGADLYMPKPYELTHLVKWVDAFVREFNR